MVVGQQSRTLPSSVAACSRLGDVSSLSFPPPGRFRDSSSSQSCASNLGENFTINSRANLIKICFLGHQRRVEIVWVPVINYDASLVSLTSFECIPQEFRRITCTRWKENEIKFMLTEAASESNTSQSPTLRHAWSECKSNFNRKRLFWRFNFRHFSDFFSFVFCLTAAVFYRCQRQSRFSLLNSYQNNFFSPCDLFLPFSSLRVFTALLKFIPCHSQNY